MDSTDVYRQLGQIEGRQQLIERRIDGLEERIEKRLAEMSAKLDNLTEVLNMGRGSWKTVATFASVVGFVMAAASMAIKWVVG